MTANTGIRGEPGPPRADLRSAFSRAGVLDALHRLSLRHHRLTGLALLRLLLGAAAVESYLAAYSRHAELWGPDGYIPLHRFRETVHLSFTSAYAWSPHPAYFEAVYHLGLVVALAFCVCGGRVLTVVHLLLYWSFEVRNGQALDHGHLLARFLLTFMIFTVCDARLSPFAARTRKRLAAREDRPSAPHILHNCAVFLMVFQICVLYLMAGLWKLLGPRWQEGTAFYYIVRSLRPPPTELLTALTSIPAITVGISYASVLLEVGFPLCAASRHRRIRELAAGAAALMHLGIIPLVGLFNFSLVMIAADALVLRDSDYRATKAELNRLALRYSSSARRHVPRRPAPSAARAQRMCARRLACARPASSKKKYHSSSRREVTPRNVPY
ncbi:HTTM domain-containing protein [Streptomyces rimosus]|uniref:HTTM domain-containing protein n=1 Tax=Streptomyces rimosus TaxID=1927 RepID=UPI0004C4ABD2|nr:HTTM domain-containing protein [Streptomyces rimosus]